MNQSALSDLLALGEGFTTEFKRSGTTGLGREICAFANATGGTILLGVADDGEVCGVGNHNRLKSEVQSIARSADPPIAVEIESAGQVLCVRVPAQQSKPYSFGGKFFIREGASSQQMSREEIREFFFKEGLIRFDETPCRSFDLERDLTEQIGSGIRRIRQLCRDYEVAEPLMDVSENWVTTTFARPIEHAADRETRYATPQAPPKYPPSTPQVPPQVSDLIRSLDGEQTQQEILIGLGLKDRKHLRTQYVQPALAEGLIEMTIPNKPRSSKQKYRLTERGRALQDQLRPTE